MHARHKWLIAMAALLAVPGTAFLLHESAAVSLRPPRRLQTIAPDPRLLPVPVFPDLALILAEMSPSWQPPEDGKTRSERVKQRFQLAQSWFRSQNPAFHQLVDTWLASAPSDAVRERWQEALQQEGKRMAIDELNVLLADPDTADFVRAAIDRITPKDDRANHWDGREEVAWEQEWLKISLPPASTLTDIAAAREDRPCPNWKNIELFLPPQKSSATIPQDVFDFAHDYYRAFILFKASREWCGRNDPLFAISPEETDALWKQADWEK